MDSNGFHCTHAAFCSQGEWLPKYLDRTRASSNLAHAEISRGVRGVSFYRLVFGDADGVTVWCGSMFHVQSTAQPVDRSQATA